MADSATPPDDTASPSPAAGHVACPDWTCSCGYDFFGGSAAYSWQLFRAHIGEA